VFTQVIEPGAVVEILHSVDFQSLVFPLPEVVAVTDALIVAPDDTVMALDEPFSVADMPPKVAKAVTEKLDRMITERIAVKIIFVFTKLF
jgi:hypothetical protein